MVKTIILFTVFIFMQFHGEHVKSTDFFSISNYGSYIFNNLNNLGIVLIPIWS